MNKVVIYIDIPKVKGKMAEKGYTNTSFAREVGISRNALFTYMKNPDRLPYAVMAKMISILCDSRSEATMIFMKSDGMA